MCAAVHTDVRVCGAPAPPDALEGVLPALPVRECAAAGERSGRSSRAAARRSAALPPARLVPRAREGQSECDRSARAASALIELMLAFN